MLFSQFYEATTNCPQEESACIIPWNVTHSTPVLTIFVFLITMSQTTAWASYPDAERERERGMYMNSKKKTKTDYKDVKDAIPVILITGCLD